jgi:hypothetical protein
LRLFAVPKRSSSISKREREAFLATLGCVLQPVGVKPVDTQIAECRRSVTTLAELAEDSHAFQARLSRVELPALQEVQVRENAQGSSFLIAEPGWPDAAATAEEVAGFAGTSMELAGLEPATSWVRSISASEGGDLQHLPVPVGIGRAGPIGADHRGFPLDSGTLGN